MKNNPVINIYQALEEEFDVVVVGSGAGGATAAAVLSQAGLKTLILEEGHASAEITSKDRFTLEGITQRYRNSGQSLALGLPLIAYVEGTGMGGSTEINSGLYHPIYKETADKWNAEQGLSLSLAELEKLNNEVKQLLKVKKALKPSTASKILIKSAKELGLTYQDVPRWVYRDIRGNLKRNTMSNTILPLAFTYSTKIVLNASVLRINHVDGSATSVTVLDKNNNKKYEIKTKTVFLAAGAVSSAKILKKSNRKIKLKNSISLHVMLKIAALYDKEVNMDDDLGSVQILEHSPTVTYGFASSAPAVLGAAFSRTKIKLPEMIKRYPRTLIYYASLSGSSKGGLLGGKTLVYQLNKKDKERLRQAGNKLLEIIHQSKPIDTVVIGRDASPKTDLSSSLNSFKVKDLDLSAVHIMSSLPISNHPASEIDQYGAVKKIKGVIVVDASALPSSPGYNPQGSVMALSLRNTRAYLKSKGVPHRDTLLTKKISQVGEKSKKVLFKKAKKVIKSKRFTSLVHTVKIVKRELHE
ncbi:MAG: GMC family oxidoreductase N-terminal domain-containing protein [Candidatus Paceibacterota bacterium]